jgi:Uma2 family endonuclease
MPAVSYRPRYSVEDYLQWEGDWELWDGVPVAMSPAPGFFHQSIGGNLLFQIKTRLLEESCPEPCEAVYETDWHIDRNTVVRPDLLVVCEKPGGQWVEKRPELVAEILSPSTRQKDLVAKRDLYAANGVPFYLIVDPEDRNARLLVLQDGGGYREEPGGTPFELHPGCRFELRIPALFA